MTSIGAVDSSVPIVTVVHDCQVLDLPESLFGSHDVPVDYIVTPTRVIRCEEATAKRPAGMIWSLLNAERIGRIPILGQLRYREWKAGKDVRLEGEAEPPEELTDVTPPENDEEEGDGRRPRVPRRRPPRRPRPEERETDRSGDEGKVNGVANGVKSGDERPRPRYGRGRRRPRQFARRVADHERTSESEKDASAERNESDHRNPQSARGGGRRFRRGFGRRYGGSGRRPNRPAENGDAHDGAEDDANAVRAGDGQGGRRRERVSESDGDAGGSRRQAEGSGQRRRGGGYGGFRRRFWDDCEGSVYVGSLPRWVRVSEFKAEVRDRDVQPLRVVWRGQSGFAFLNFRTVEDAEHALSALEGLHISDRSLRLEMAKSQGTARRRRNASPSRSDGGGDDGAQSDEA